MIFRMRVCALCGRELEETLAVFRSSTCPRCGKDLRICLNCRFYKPGAHWDCGETIGEPVAEKDRSNFCEFFQFRSLANPIPAPEQKGKALDSFNKLFGD